MKRKRLHPSRSGVTLLELLIVIGLITLLGALMAPSVRGRQDALHLTQAATMLRTQLNLARQMAITLNQPITLHLCQSPDEQGMLAYNLLALTRVDTDGGRVLVDRPVAFSHQITLSEAPELSSLMAAPAGSVNVRGVARTSRQIRFDPDGSAALTPGGSWFATVRKTRSEAELISPEPGDNFVTLVIDPVTGRVIAYQP